MKKKRSSSHVPVGLASCYMNARPFGPTTLLKLLVAYQTRKMLDCLSLYLDGEMYTFLYRN
jgi:hypothetical protein